MIALDIETKSLDEDHPEYALQPWRVRTGEAEIPIVAISNKDKDKVSLHTENLQALDLTGPIVGWNVGFDVAFLYAAGVDVSRGTWIDAMLLAKWVENCQDNDKLGFSLAACANRYLKDWPLLDKFTKLKAIEADPENDKYWSLRAKLDVIATLEIAKRCLKVLTPKQKRSALIEAGNIVPNAIAWVEGIPTNPKYYEDPIPGLSAQMAEIECRLGVQNQGSHEQQLGGKGWTPSKVLRSPLQLRSLLYETWRLPCEHYTEKNQPSTDKRALTYLADKDDNVLEILAWRNLNTRLTKFCQSPMKAQAYLGSSTLHPEPKIFSTYTGRYTYGSKIKNKYHVSMALHQMPRGKEVRRMVEAPAGKLLVEFDASGQEARLLAEIGNVESMLEVFRSGKKIHAVMGASIAGIPYDEFMKRYKAQEESYAGPGGLYYCGKFINLSMQYRVGAAKQRVMARVQYDLQKDITTIQRWRALYHHTYPEVQYYWQRAVDLARRNGYAETLAGRRYYLSKWDQENRWATESSAINFPIQGSGADMKNLAISTITKKFPELEFKFDVHDGLGYYIPEDECASLVFEVKEALDNLPYKQMWGWVPQIPLPWDSSLGRSWGTSEEIQWEKYLCMVKSSKKWRVADILKLQKKVIS